MTVKELKELLETMNDDREIAIMKGDKDLTIEGTRKTKLTNELIINVK